MTNGHGIAYNLSTYHGPADLCTMTAANVLTQIVDPCLQMGPITLENADFNLAAANIDTTKHRDLLNSKILQLGFKQKCAAMFKQLCPSYSDQPHAVIEHIRQSAPGPDGQLIVATVHEYFQCLHTLPGLLPPARHCQSFFNDGIVGTGYVVANGLTDIGDPKSGLHVCKDPQKLVKDGYISVKTQKLTNATFNIYLLERELFSRNVLAQ